MRARRRGLRRRQAAKRLREEDATDVTTLAHRLGLAPESPTLLEALTHSSYAAEHDAVSNERLEFLGDAVVGLAVADYVIEHFPAFTEASATVLRARVVNEDALAEAARALSLGDVLRVGKGVIKERGTERPSLLADAFEAVVAAVYLDNDFPAAKLFVLEMLGGAITQATATDLLMDAKTRLRQWSELEALGEPHYEVRADGPSHDVTFYATVTVGDIVATGSGRSKKKAELAAAQAAWEEHHA